MFVQEWADDLREWRKAKKKKKQEEEKQRRLRRRTHDEVEQAFLLALEEKRVDECRAMAIEDAQALAIEMRERLKELLEKDHAHRLRVQGWKEENILEENQRTKEPGLATRFLLDAKTVRFRNSPEFFDAVHLGVPVQVFKTLNHEIGVLSKEFLKETGEIHSDVVLCGCGDGTLRILNMAFPQEAKIIGRANRAAPVNDAILLNGTTTFLYCCGDGRIRAGWADWRKPEPPEKMASFKGRAHRNVVTGILQSQDFVFTWSLDGTIKIWNSESGDLHQTFCSRGGVSKCIISGGILISCGDDSDPNIRLWAFVGDVNDAEVDEFRCEWFDSFCCDCDFEKRRIKDLTKNPQLRSSEIGLVGLKKKEQNLIDEENQILKKRAEEMKEIFAKKHGGIWKIFHDHLRPGSVSHATAINSIFWMKAFLLHALQMVWQRFGVSQKVLFFKASRLIAE